MTNGIGRVGWRNFVSVAPTTASIITTGLVLNLDAGNTASYPGTGTTWTDLTGNGNNGTLTNGTSYSSTNGGVMVFDGVNDYVTGNTPTSINLNNDLTIETWVKFSSTINTRIIEIQDANYSIQILIDNGSGKFATKHSKWETGYSNRFWDSKNNSVWYNITCVFTPSTNTTKLYQNGIEKSSTGGNAVGIGNQPNKFILGVRGDLEGTTYLNGSLPITRIYNRALSSTEVLQNFDATKSRYGFTSYTTRTAAFATATGITDTTILNALNTFDLGLISNGLATKMKALYPMVGGTANTHKFNFMDARDVNAAFRLQFNGGGVHSSTGYKPNGTNAYGNTFYNQTTQGDNVNSGHLSYYSRTNSNGAEVEIGTEVNSVAYNLLEIRTAGTTYFLMNQTSISVFADSDSLGFYVGNRTSSNVINGWKNGVKKGSSTAISTSIANRPIYLAGLNSDSALYYSTKECAFASIGSGLTDGEATTFYNLVQAMQTSLSRQV